MLVSRSSKFSCVEVVEKWLMIKQVVQSRVILIKSKNIFRHWCTNMRHSKMLISQQISGSEWKSGKVWSLGRTELASKNFLIKITINWFHSQSKTVMTWFLLLMWFPTACSTLFLRDLCIFLCFYCLHTPKTSQSAI